MPDTDINPTTTEAIDIIVLGRRLIDVAVDARGVPVGDWDATQCDFVDCPEVVYVRPNDIERAIDLYMARDVDDDRLMQCCIDHRNVIDNYPAVIGGAYEFNLAILAIVARSLLVSDSRESDRSKP